MTETTKPKRRLKADLEEELIVRLQQLKDAELPVARYYEIIEENPTIAARYRTRDEHRAWLDAQSKKDREEREQDALRNQGRAYRHMSSVIENVEPKRFLWFEYYPKDAILEAYRREMNRLATANEVV